MFIIYDIISAVFAVLLVPVYLVKGKFHRGFLARLGFLPETQALDGPIWVHAVSVGEAMAMRGLVEELRKAFPGKKFVISTVTATGNKIAKGMASYGDLVTYLPLDLSFIVKSVISKINPCAFIIAETEIWPNLISCLYQKKIPVVIVNGRISDTSFRGYASVKFLVEPVLKKVSFFCVQAKRDLERLKQLGAPADKIAVTGNMKFDLAGHLPEAGARDKYRKALGLTGEEKLLVAASTHPQEEEIILKVYQKLSADFPSLRLLLAPRHPERAKEVGNLVTKTGFTPVLISRLSVAMEEGRWKKDDGRRTRDEAERREVFILDIIGELNNYYAASDIVFVGGSLVKKGGHNIIEPASQGKPVLFGEHMFNFRDIARLFLEADAAIMVGGAGQLEEKARLLLEDGRLRQRLQEAASRLILENQGAAVKNLQCLKNLINS